MRYLEVPDGMTTEETHGYWLGRVAGLYEAAIAANSLLGGTFLGKQETPSDVLFKLMEICENKAAAYEREHGLPRNPHAGEYPT